MILILEIVKGECFIAIIILAVSREIAGDHVFFSNLIQCFIQTKGLRSLVRRLAAHFVKITIACLFEFFTLSLFGRVSESFDDLHLADGVVIKSAISPSIGWRPHLKPLIVLRLHQISIHAFKLWTLLEHGTEATTCVVSAAEAAGLVERLE